jgi:hypothetical protein
LNGDAPTSPFRQSASAAVGRRNMRNQTEGSALCSSALRSLYRPQRIIHNHNKGIHTMSMVIAVTIVYGRGWDEECSSPA